MTMDVTSYRQMEFWEFLISFLNFVPEEISNLRLGHVAQYVVVLFNMKLYQCLLESFLKNNFSLKEAFGKHELRSFHFNENW